MDLSNFRMDLWEKIVPTFKYNPEIPFFEMLVPTMDTVRYGYLMEKLLAIKHPVLFTGTTGVGKVSHVIVHHVLHTENTNRIFAPHKLVTILAKSQVVFIKALYTFLERSLKESFFGIKFY